MLGRFPRRVLLWFAVPAGAAIGLRTLVPAAAWVFARCAGFLGTQKGVLAMSDGHPLSDPVFAELYRRWRPGAHLRCPHCGIEVEVWAGESTRRVSVLPPTSALLKRMVRLEEGD